MPNYSVKWPNEAQLKKMQ